MLCPNCLTVMRCITAINPVPGQPGRDRMDLHCVKPDGQKRGCNMRCHMGVITEDPKVWECHQYGFNFGSYILSSHNDAVDPYHQGQRKAKTSLFHKGKEIYSLSYFIPISTGDDMHEEAWKLFNKLSGYIPFI